jgi:alpha-N-arabinofuranosidase
VRIANIAQIVNVIAPVLTRGDDLLMQSIYYPFQMFSARRKGVALKPALQGPLYQSRSWGVVPFIDVSAILAPGRVHVFVTNRHTTEQAEIGVDPADFQIVRLEKAEILTGPDAKAANTFDAPDLVTARDFRDVGIRKGRARFQLPPLSLGAFTFAIE